MAAILDSLKKVSRNVLYKTRYQLWSIPKINQFCWKSAKIDLSLVTDLWAFEWKFVLRRSQDLVWRTHWKCHYPELMGINLHMTKVCSVLYTWPNMMTMLQFCLLIYNCIKWGEYINNRIKIFTCRNAALAIVSHNLWPSFIYMCNCLCAIHCVCFLRVLVKNWVFYGLPRGPPAWPVVSDHKHLWKCWLIFTFLRN